ncbi:MAG: hypothetical protein AB1831_11525 [Pseudomonadota bacterium]
MKQSACLPLAVLAAVLAAGTAQAARPAGDCRAAERAAFSSLPMLLPAGRGERSGAAYCLANLRADAVAQRNGAGGFTAAPAAVPVRDGGFKVSAGRVGNYHWLQAAEDSQAGLFTASTAHYFANPGPAPTAMLELPKAELEIVPQPLPREHWRYRAGETWGFLLRLHGRPLANAGVRLETSGGTQRVLRSDAAGVVRVTFPEDVAEAGVGHAHGREAQNRFVLAVGHTDAAGRYRLSAFNHVYGAAADSGRSLGAGLGFLALGGLLALPLTIRRKEAAHG